MTAFYAHPFDAVAATFVSGATAYLVLEQSDASLAWAPLFVSLFKPYIHSDTASPRWLDYDVQRPEMHRVHHQFDHHAQNDGLPLWDLPFGTFANPQQRVERCSFTAERQARVFEMLRGRDVHTCSPARTPASSRLALAGLLPRKALRPELHLPSVAGRIRARLHPREQATLVSEGIPARDGAKRWIATNEEWSEGIPSCLRR
ncbi:sterol desaturase family protein [Aquabacterium sp. A7-Y]|uniref:sterol desaturase family protein n=1 Tax=Aquabacterium sp. A7-Y TaxID=1349605 RepID=UPI00223DC0DB|nr:sterol desaturase family protein [Aquabacterium sp. A7-Y]MCW7539686.1 sterol desaturase family protein [Aquabacterium sp. A7-Y]